MKDWERSRKGVYSKHFPFFPFSVKDIYLQSNASEGVFMGDKIFVLDTLAHMARIGNHVFP